MGRPAGRTLIPTRVDPSLDADKVRGVLLGILAGEALGAEVDGMDRDDILRRHGRIVRRSATAGAGKLTTAVLALAASLDSAASDPHPAAEAPDDLPGALCAGLVRSLGGSPHEPADPVLAEASRWLGAVLPLALDESPYRRLRADLVLAGIARVSRLPGAAATLEQLRLETLSPPRPSAAIAVHHDLAPPLQTATLAIHALLVRPRSAEAAMVYAVNLGGAAALRGALTGALAGAHRGAASIPERWLLGLPEVTALDDLATRIAARRCNP